MLVVLQNGKLMKCSNCGEASITKIFFFFEQAKDNIADTPYPVYVVQRVHVHYSLK